LLAIAVVGIEEVLVFDMVAFLVEPAIFKFLAALFELFWCELRLIGLDIG
jgi:hypothetical protein